jgi:hypothetical protein
MTRGVYGPVDRDNRFIVQWSEDKASWYAREKAYDLVTDPIRPLSPGIDKALRLNKAVRWMRAGMQIGGREEAAKPLAQVGGEFFYSIADRQRAITRLAFDFQSLANDLTTWHSANMDASNATTLVQWFAADVTPTLEEWQKFVETENKSWWTKAATKWETFEDWQDRLRRLRGLARAHGIMLESPEPEDLPATVWKRGAEGKGGEGAALLGVLKVAVATALGITGFVTMFAVVRELKRPRALIRVDADPEHPEIDAIAE